VRLQAQSPPSGAVPVSLGEQPGADRFSLFGLAPSLPGTRGLRAWSRRQLIEQVFRILKPRLAVEACQGRSEDASSGHVVLRLMARCLLYYTSRKIFQGQVPRDEMGCNGKPHWSSVTCELLELSGIS
jgi:hypothetical protein